MKWKWKRIDFTSNQYFKNNAENPAAVYFTQDDPSFEFYHTMMINNVPNIDIIMQISYILHEIQHFNQHMTWNKGIEQRKKYINGKKLPEDFDIKNYTFTDLILFWEKEYGYKNSPNEVDANNFAIKNLKKDGFYIVAVEQAPGARKYTTLKRAHKTALVFGQMNEVPGARLRVALTGLTMAEYFRDEKNQEERYEK